MFKRVKGSTIIKLIKAAEANQTESIYNLGSGEHNMNQAEDPKDDNQSVASQQTAKSNITNVTAVTIGTTAASFTIVMEAQDGVATKTYTFNLSRISDDVELTKLEYAVAGSSTTNTISLVGKTYTVSSGILYAKSGFTIYPTLKSGQTVTIEDLDNSAAGAVDVTSSGKAYTFVDNPTDVYAATTKTLTMKVKSAFGSVETYTINITRDKADETVTFSTITITYTASGSSKTKSVTTPTAGVYEITGVPYGVTNYTVEIELQCDFSKNTYKGKESKTTITTATTTKATTTTKKKK